MTTGTAVETPVAVDAPWTYLVLDEIDSTNTFAGKLAAWTAVRAKTQTAGRGRTAERRWVSDPGGLWLSAVLPCPGPRNRWETLPLVAGAAVADALHSCGVRAPRLRWPNDIMVGRAKLAGLLVERYTETTAVVGIGVNVANDPECGNPELAGHTARLCDLVSAEVSIDDVARRVLEALRREHTAFMASGFDPVASKLNAGWQGGRRVEATFVGARQSRAGVFHGVDGRGRLRVALNGAEIEAFDATQITLLRELD